MTSQLNDEDLLEAWRNGDRNAGESLFERYYRNILRFFRNKIGNQDEIGDLAHQTFVACVEGRDRLRDSSSFRAYLFGVACNVLRGYWKRKYRDRPVDLDEVTADELAPSPSVIYARHHEERLLLKALRKIAIEQQILLELRYWEGLKSRQIAEILGLPDNTVRSRLVRSIARLEGEIARLATTPELLASTVDNLDKWANSCRKQLGDRAPDESDESGESDDQKTGDS